MDPCDSPPVSLTVWYSYALIRVVPRVERGELVNVGVILFAPTAQLLDARIELDADRLSHLAPDLDLGLVERHLATFRAICDGVPEGGPIADLPQAERFHWLTSPRSTIIQTSEVHAGCCESPETALDELMDAYVRPVRTVSTQHAQGA